jgi:hypothetical protein
LVEPELNGFPTVKLTEALAKQLQLIQPKIQLKTTCCGVRKTKQDYTPKAHKFSQNQEDISM